MRTPRGPASKLAALALGTLIAVTLAEGIARLAERHAAGRDAAAAADTRDRRPPTKRFPEPQAERGDLRILVIGDSFTVGGVYAVEETFPGRLQELLDGRLGAVSFEVLTLASSGWNTEEEFQQARPFVKALAPDLILVGVCLNDPEPSDQALVRRHFSEAGLSDSQSSEGWWPYRASAAVRLGVDGYRAWRSRPAVRRYYRSFYSEELPSWQAFRPARARAISTPRAQAAGAARARGVSDLRLAARPPLPLPGSPREDRRHGAREGDPEPRPPLRLRRHGLPVAPGGAGGSPSERPRPPAGGRADLRVPRSGRSAIGSPASLRLSG